MKVTKQCEICGEYKCKIDEDNWCDDCEDKMELKPEVKSALLKQIKDIKDKENKK